MKKIIVTGCRGQLGRAIGEVMGDTGEYELVNTDVEELDITDIDSVMALAAKEKPYAIINCAAFTNVNGCEDREDLAFRINAIGPRNLAIAAQSVGAKIVQISTDYVFPGDGSKPYRETDATGPSSAYGRTKLAAEQFVRDFSDRYFILRTAWLFGEGNNFVRTMLKLSETRDTLTVVGDQVGSPTHALDLAKAIAAIIPTDNYGIFHATSEGVCSWAEFAREIFRLAGKNVEVISVTTEEYARMSPGQADRPKYSVLDNYMLRLTGGYEFPHWTDAIAAYLKRSGIV